MLKIPLHHVTRIAAGNPEGKIIVEYPKPQPLMPLVSGSVSGSAEIRGLGDVVAMVAQPFARAADRLLGTNLVGCAGCKQRQETLNQKVPFG